MTTPTFSIPRVTVGAIGLAALAILIDQVTKQWALVGLGNGEVVPLLPFFKLQLAFNPGAAFGMGAQFGPLLAAGILIILTALTTWIVVRIAQRREARETYLLAIIAGGGWGNMIDRIMRAEEVPLSGTVVDFFALDNFAIFNMGDVLAVTGMCLWVLTRLVLQPRLRESSSQPQG